MTTSFEAPDRDRGIDGHRLFWDSALPAEGPLQVSSNRPVHINTDTNAIKWENSGVGVVD